MKSVYDLKKSVCKKGFTLIELLVVIAIIAILASILFPVFARARENARRSSCQSNLKQIGLGIMQYTQDYDETLPRPYQTGLAGAFCDAIVWGDMVQPYLKSLQVFHCPSANNTNAPKVPIVSFPSLHMSYGVNAEDTASALGIGGSFGDSGKIADFSSPAETFFVGEITDATNVEYGYMVRPLSSADGQHRLPGTHHFDGGNWLYADGHVKYLLASKTGENSNYFWKRNK
jgi:prepilin-type N-terminal cleavage/methylation domain-containing protein/prepilin-type processing-associated H-X9-DG protein